MTLSLCPSVRHLPWDNPADACYLCDKPAILRDTIKGTLCGMNKANIDCCDGLRIKQHGY